MDTNTTLNVSLPKRLKQYVKQRVSERQYSNPSDYVRSLIREDQARREEEMLEKMLLEGLASGAGEEMSGAAWKKLHSDVRRELRERSRRI